MNDIQKIVADLAGAGRVETGVLQINDDWPGVFIRGDNAMHYAMNLRRMIAELEKHSDGNLHDAFAVSTLKSLLSILEKSRVR